MNVSGARMRVVAEVGGGLLVMKRRVVVLDRHGVLADLLPPDDVVVGMLVVQPDQALMTMTRLVNLPKSDLQQT